MSGAGAQHAWRNISREQGAEKEIGPKYPCRYKSARFGVTTARFGETLGPEMGPGSLQRTKKTML